MSDLLNLGTAKTEPAPAPVVQLHPDGVRVHTAEDGRKWLQSWRAGAVRAQFVVSEEDLEGLKRWLR